MSETQDKLYAAVQAAFPEALFGLDHGRLVMRTPDGEYPVQEHGAWRAETPAQALALEAYELLRHAIGARRLASQGYGLPQLSQIYQGDSSARRREADRHQDNAQALYAKAEAKAREAASLCGVSLTETYVARVIEATPTLHYSAIGEPRWWETSEGERLSLRNRIQEARYVDDACETCGWAWRTQRDPEDLLRKKRRGRYGQCPKCQTDLAGTCADVPGALSGSA